jgi:probable F420-dependent oxidoreductase
VANRTDWLRHARRVEAAGFDTLLLPDHLAGGLVSPLSALVVAAEATTNLRIGTLVLNNDLRHPVVLAREAATIDLLTDGRLELGLGAGYQRAEYVQSGISMDPALVRIERMEEAAQLLRLLWSGEEVSFDGTHYQVDAHVCLPGAGPRPIPLLVGGNGPRVLEVAARHADTVGFIGLGQDPETGRLRTGSFTSAGLAQQVAEVRRLASARTTEVEFSILVQEVILTGDRRAAAEKVRSWLPDLSVEELLDSPYILTGTAGEMAEQLRVVRERFGVTYITVFAEASPAIEQVMEAL